VPQLQEIPRIFDTHGEFGFSWDLVQNHDYIAVYVLESEKIAKLFHILFLITQPSIVYKLRRQD